MSRSPLLFCGYAIVGSHRYKGSSARNKRQHEVNVLAAHLHEAYEERGRLEHVFHSLQESMSVVALSALETFEGQALNVSCQPRNLSVDNMMSLS